MEGKKDFDVEGRTIDLLPNSPRPPPLVPAVRSEGRREAVRAAPANSVEAIVGAAPPVETLDCGRPSIGEFHSENDLGVRINARAMVADGDLVGEPDDGACGDLRA